MESGTSTTRTKPAMTAERWEQLKRLFDSAIERPEDERREFVRACSSGDPSLEADLSELLANYERTAITLELDAAATLRYPGTRQSPHVLQVGQFIARRFGIIRFINQGGMGEVYEAWDSELLERVALKTIRGEIAASPTIIERFKQEVKRARGISHPNVCRVYDLFFHELENGERLWFLAMELLTGKTLLETLREQGKFKPNAALDLVDQMVAGLAAAHDLGVVHRDFKSGNVMLVPAGDKVRAVITDFGLAINVSSNFHGSNEVGRGGTPAYMAPEQSQDGKVSFASDQYALGVVMCEMLTGHRPKRLVSDIDGSNVQLPGTLKPRWEGVIRRCLQAAPANRFSTVRQIAQALHPRRMWNRVEVWAAAFAFALLTVGIAGVTVLRRDQIRVEHVSELTPGTDFSTSPSISRDGRVIAYTSDRGEPGNLDIWLQRLPTGTPTRITSDPAEDKYPALSPDGNSIVFRSERGGGGIYIANSAGTTQRLLVAGGRNPQFSPDGRRIVYWTGDKDDSVPSGRLYLLSLVDGRSQPLAADFSDARWPVWSSDGAHILFYGCRAPAHEMPSCLDWWVISAYSSKVQNTGALALLRQQNVEPFEELGGWYDDTVLFTGRHAGTTSIWGLKVSRNTLHAEGKPQQLTSGVSRDVDPSLAQNGTLVFSHLSGALHIWKITNASHPKEAEVTKVTQDAGTDSTPNISPDGRWLFFSRLSGTQRDLWIKDMKTGAENLLQAPGTDKLSPIVDESGKLVAFEGRKGDVPAIYVTSPDQPTKELCIRCSKPTGWFDHDRAVFYRSGSPSAIQLADPKTGKVDTVLESREFSLGEASWSPENQYLLFTASRAGENKQIFAVQFPRSTARATGVWIPITEPSYLSDRPKWSGDGKVIFYLSTRDGFACVWGQHFDPAAGKAIGDPFPVMHYHNLRISPSRITPRSFDLSVSGDTIYLNVGEETASLFTGVLKAGSSLLWPF